MFSIFASIISLFISKDKCYCCSDNINGNNSTDGLCFDCYNNIMYTNYLNIAFFM